MVQSEDRGRDVVLPPFSVAPELESLVSTGHVALDGIRVEPSGAAIDAAFAALEDRYCQSWGTTSIGSIPGITSVRRLFHSLHIDPTRTRPSSEALLRRVLKGKGLFRISNAVDVCNLCSLETLLPMGLYDLHAVTGAVHLQLGQPGDRYDGIRKDPVRVEGRPTLYDARGPFGQPISDSLRTSVQDATTALYLVVYAPIDSERGTLDAVLHRCTSLYQELCGADPISSLVVPGVANHEHGATG